jgi:hypothetical protein
MRIPWLPYLGARFPFAPFNEFSEAGDNLEGLASGWFKPFTDAVNRAENDTKGTTGSM